VTDERASVIPSRGPRDRVVDHLRTALSVGVASVMVTGCTSCIVSDPLPQPSACSVGPVSSSVATTLKRVGTEVTIEIILSGRLQAVGPVTAIGAPITGQVQVSPRPHPRHGSAGIRQQHRADAARGLRRQYFERRHQAARGVPESARCRR
jgi:hypothetical protein